ncbi:MAG: beta strand repeat-containing protein [Bacteroidota bacterium]
MTAAAALMALSRPAPAAPQGGSVASGSATISQSGTTTTVTQSSDKGIINWRSFSVAGNEAVNFRQPNASSMTLNRVIGNEKSVIDGALNANGKVFLVNSAGVLIGGGANINASGFTASALNITDADFNAGKFTFSGAGPSTGDVVNLGTITAENGGYVTLLGRTVSNRGTIVATKGTVALAAANKVTLNFNGNSLISVTVDEGVLNALVENKQAIYADGGSVILTAKAADALLSAQVNNSGVIQARTIDDLTGKIELYAHGGTTMVDGTLDASAPAGGDGGSIETSGDKVTIAEGMTVTTASARGKTGTWLLDPYDLTITDGTGALDPSSGSATSGSSGSTVRNTDLQAALAHTNVVLATGSGGSQDGNINVNAAVTWSADTALTLTAAKNININKSITASGTNAGLALNYGGGGDYAIDTANGAKVTLSGNHSTLSMNGTAYTLIHSMGDLAGEITTSSNSGHYAIANDMPASGTTYTGAVVSALNGTLAGLGHTISNLTIDSTGNRAGLIGTLGGSSNHAATIRDLGLVNASVKGKQNVGSLVGLSYGVLSNDYTQNVSITATDTNVGGLVGQSNAGTIRNSYATGSVTGPGNAGGLVGNSYGATSVISNSWANVTVLCPTGCSGSGFGGLAGNNQGTVSNSYALGSVSAYSGNSPVNSIGGLFGANSGTVTNAYARGAVTATNGNWVGGLVGRNAGGALTDVSASGAVNVSWTLAPSSTATTQQDIGGLVGQNIDYGGRNGTITRGTAYGDVTVSSINSSNYAGYVGGLVGNSLVGTISDSHAYGKVTGNGYVNTIGGFIGKNSSTITNSTSNNDVLGYMEVGGFVGLNAGTITYSNSKGSVTSTGRGNVGGFAGQNGNSATIAYSTADAKISGQGIVGGFAGTNSGLLDHVSVTGRAKYAFLYGTVNGFGALVGNNAIGDHSVGTVRDSTAKVQGPASLIGRTLGTTVVIGNTFYNFVAADAAAETGTQAASTSNNATGKSGAAGIATNSGAKPSTEANIIFSGDYSADVTGARIDDERDTGGNSGPPRSNQAPQTR